MHYPVGIQVERPERMEREKRLSAPAFVRVRD